MPLSLVVVIYIPAVKITISLAINCVDYNQHINLLIATVYYKHLSHSKENMSRSSAPKYITSMTRQYALSSNHKVHTCKVLTTSPYINFDCNNYNAEFATFVASSSIMINPPSRYWIAKTHVEAAHKWVHELYK